MRSFTILLLIQACSVAWALYYGHHPEAESIDVGRHSAERSRDTFIIEAAKRRGMDSEAVAELLRTKQPVVKVKAEPNGVTKTTTYSLDSDGGISSKTVTESRSVKHYEAGTLPDSVALDDILKSPSGTVTRTFTDKDGAKVTQTFGVSKPKTTSILVSDDNVGGTRPHIPTWSGSPTNIHHTPFRPWPSEPEEGKSTNLHKTIQTFTGPNGEKRVVETWSSNPNVSPPQEPKFPSTNWPSFDFSDFSQPWQPTDTMGDPSDWTVVEGNPNAEATTKYNFPSWTPKTWRFPDYPTFETTTTTAKPNRMPAQPKATTPLPSLDDFLKTQYGQTTAPTKPATTTARPVSLAKSTKPPVTIKVEDLPITHILHNGQPADESIIRRLPPHMVPRTNTENVLKIENIHPIEAETVPTNVETNVRTITKTHIGHSKPALSDLDPQMQEILRNAGISTDDITNIEGDTITKTRKEPDGRVITTTYKVRTSPAVATTYEEVQPTNQVFSTPHQHNPLASPIVPHHTPFTPTRISPISEFLAKLGLTKSDIFLKNGEYTRSIIDDDGQVLTATFVLSSPINRNKAPTHESPPKTNPLK